MSVNTKALKELRLRAGISRERLAIEAGVSASIIAKLEMGYSSNPEIRTLKSIAEALANRLNQPVNIVLMALIGEEAPHA